MTKKNSLTLDLIGQHTAKTLKQLKRSDGEGPARHLGEAERIGRRFYERLETIEADARLTGVGKSEARREAGREAIAAVEKWHKPLAESQAAAERQWLGELYSAASPKPSSDLAERVERALLRSEIRQAARGLTAHELELLYRKADSHVVREALDETPIVEKTKDGAVIVRPFVSPELKREVTIDAGRRAKPELADQLDDLRELQGVYSTVASAFKREVETLAPGSVEPAKVTVS